MAPDEKCAVCGAPALMFRVRDATASFACSAHGAEGEGWLRIDTPTKKTIPSTPSSMPPPRGRSAG